MSDFWRFATSVIGTAAFIACLWWANAALRQLNTPRRFDLSASVRLLIVLSVGGLVFGPVNRILSGFFAVFADYYPASIKAAEVLGALAVLAFVGWLYTRAVLEK